MSDAIMFIILSDGDQRAADLTRRAISCIPDATCYGVITDSRELGGNREPLSPSGDVDVRRLAWWESQHRAALAIAREQPGDALVCILRDGAIPGPDFREAALSLLDSPPRVSGVVLGIGRARNINRLAAEELDCSDPWSLLPDAFEYGSEALKARYQRPCAVVFRASAIQGRDFESFSSLADWYAFRRLFEINPGTLRIAATFLHLGYIGSKPDRRNPYEQGRVAAQALYQIAFAYPQFREDVRHDFRTIVLSPIRGLTGSQWRTHGSFLAGLAAAAWQERGRRHKLNRDIREIS